MTSTQQLKYLIKSVPLMPELYKSNFCTAYHLFFLNTEMYKGPSFFKPKLTT